MSIRSQVARLAGPEFRRRPAIQQAVQAFDTGVETLRHSVATILPQVIQPDPTEIYVTLTANCNLRCLGCRYGRDFMPGAQLPLPILNGLLEDCATFGIKNVRLYGGEPLLHKDLPRIVERAVELGLHPWLTTNGILLKEKIDALYSAGLRSISIGFYGTGDEYNDYVQRKEQYRKLEASVEYVRERYGMSVDMVLGWVLMRPTCTLDSIRETWAFAEHFLTPIGISLIHYSLPYFTEGPDGILQFHAEDRPAIDVAVSELIRLKQLRPVLIKQSLIALRSIPDWLIKGPDMKVPCDRYHLLWIGADGTVQLCYVTFKLGNLHEKRLAELLFTKEHRRASRDAYALRCPNCHCSYHKRVEIHIPSRLKYS